MTVDSLTIALKITVCFLTIDRPISHNRPSYPSQFTVQSLTVETRKTLMRQGFPGAYILKINVIIYYEYRADEREKENYLISIFHNRTYPIAMV